MPGCTGAGTESKGVSAGHSVGETESKAWINRTISPGPRSLTTSVQVRNTSRHPGKRQGSALYKREPSVWTQDPGPGAGEGTRLPMGVKC